MYKKLNLYLAGLLLIFLTLNSSCTDPESSAYLPSDKPCNYDTDCDPGYSCNKNIGLCMENGSNSGDPSVIDSNGQSNSNSSNTNSNVSNGDFINNYNNTDGNLPPVMNRLEDQRVVAGELLSFFVSASDPEGDSLTFGISGLPEGALFDSNAATFNWTPLVDDVGVYSDIRFYVADGRSSVHTSISIQVMDAPIDPNDHQSDPVERCEDGGLPCFGSCCSDGEQCFDEGCNVPGQACFSASDCLLGFYCEPLLAQCLPLLEESSEGCEYHPPSGVMMPAPQWIWTGESASGCDSSKNQVISLPIVVNLTDDNSDGLIDHRDIPDVAFVAFSGSGSTFSGVLRVLSGDDGHEHFCNNSVALAVESQPAAGDIDGDGIVELIFVSQSYNLTAFEHDGTVKWTSSSPANGVQWGGPAIVDIDGTGYPEIIAGGTVFDANGTVKFNVSPGSATNLGVLSLAADIESSYPGIELLLGNQLYSAQGHSIRSYGNSAGLTAVANFDNDADPEIVMIASGQAWIYNRDGTIMCGPTAFPCSGGAGINRGGAPTVADFDGDGQMEFASAGGNCYVVFETDCSVKWWKPTQDHSSNVTASSVFDFEGDGFAEVVYNDEKFLRIYRGSDGEVLYEYQNPTNTTFEYPVIVDVDGDNNAEIVVAANNFSHPGDPGIKVFSDKSDNWVNSRKIWNQHTYHINNINEDGTIPRVEEKSWETHNTYRLNIQGDNLFNAPDLIVTLTIDRVVCPEKLTLVARVRNVGSLGVRAGLWVSFYRVDPTAGEVLIGSAQTEEDLYPGGETHVVYEWIVPTDMQPHLHTILVKVDTDGTGLTEHNECEEGNNSSMLNDVICSESFCPDEVPYPSDEICDGIDNDCDGLVDEDENGTGVLYKECFTACGSGVMTCKSGQWSPCNAPIEMPEICNGIDDDCDGTVDDGLLCEGL